MVGVALQHRWFTQGCIHIWKYPIQTVDTELGSSRGATPRTFSKVIISVHKFMLHYLKKLDICLLFCNLGFLHPLICFPCICPCKVIYNEAKYLSGKLKILKKGVDAVVVLKHSTLRYEIVKRS